MTETLGSALERASEPAERKTVWDLLERQKPELEKALPAAIGVERFTRTVMTELRRTPKLLECSPDSLLGSMMLAAQLGLEPGPLDHVYLVPFRREVTFIIGYKGMIELAYRSGFVKDIRAEVVRDGDSFTFTYGTSPQLHHRPSGPPGEREVTHAYAVARLKTGGTPFVVTYPEDWERARKASPAGSKGVGPWVDDWSAMVRKTAVRRLQPFLPQSPQLAHAVERDDQPVPFADADVLGPLEGEVPGA